MSRELQELREYAKGLREHAKATQRFARGLSQYAADFERRLTEFIDAEPEEAERENGYRYREERIRV